MPHTLKSKRPLIPHVRWIEGPVEALAKELEQEADGPAVRQRIVVTRRAVNGLVAEVLQGGLREHIGGTDIPARQYSADLEAMMAVFSPQMKPIRGVHFAVRGNGRTTRPFSACVARRMARTTFPFCRLGQIAQDAAFAGSLRCMASIAQGVQLPFKRSKRCDLLVNTSDLPVDQLIDFFAGQFRSGLKAAQDTHLGQSDAERTAMTDEVELHQMRFGVAAVAVGLSRGGREQSFPFVEADRLNVAIAQSSQFSGSHALPFTKSVDSVSTTGFQMVPLFSRQCQRTLSARSLFRNFIRSRNCK